MSALSTLPGVLDDDDDDDDNAPDININTAKDHPRILQAEVRARPYWQQQ